MLSHEEENIMASSKKELTAVELVETHKPKNFKFKYIFNDDSLLKALMDDPEFDISSLDTINDDELVEAALGTEYTMYEREIVGKAKCPTIMDDGIIISKKMITKADKKLLGVYIGFFECRSRHVCIKFHYEKFDIIEIFNLI